MPVLAWTAGESSVVLELDLTLYSVDAVLRAAYKFTDRGHVFLSRDPSKAALIAVIAPKQQPFDPAVILGEFSNEVVDQRLRESLDAQFGQLRTLVVAQAFSEGNLIDPGQDDGDYRSDPRGAGKRR